MTESELRREHKYRYEERLGIMEVWGVPTEWQHNLAVQESDEAVKKLRAENGMVAKLRELRLSL